MALSESTINELNTLHAKAEKIYGPVGDNFRGESALSAEYREVIRAFDARDWAQLRDELMDLANVATRWAQAIDAGEVACYKRVVSAPTISMCDITAEVVADLIDKVDDIRRELDDAESYRMEQMERQG